ncbi:hypothetical protein [Companilactobacillus furfuricola]|uniref:hypothetical protein n=1 Tax=Companilactobacillus furfuricola TaxID=1462575 RepID=UPI0013DDD375|nr:hypothetical protein [Companilactobacillus furfuricola]
MFGCYVQCRFRVGARYGTGTLPTRFELIREDRPNNLKYESSSKLLRRQEEFGG